MNGVTDGRTEKHMRQKFNAVVNLILKTHSHAKYFLSIRTNFETGLNTHHAGKSSYENRPIIVQEKSHSN